MRSTEACLTADNYTSRKNILNRLSYIEPELLQELHELGSKYMQDRSMFNGVYISK